METDAPHRIATLGFAPAVPPQLTPRLPARFDEWPLDAATPPDARLIVVSGVPGTGKSTLADALGRALRVPVFAIDWLLGALTSFGGRRLDALWDIGHEQLTTLALRQLQLGQSAILDTPAEDPEIRERWISLARRFGTPLRVVECHCSDPAIHQRRVEGRVRGIPGWHDPGHWPNVQERLRVLRPWPTPTLRIDAVHEPEDNVRRAVRHLTSA